MLPLECKLIFPRLAFIFEGSSLIFARALQIFKTNLTYQRVIINEIRGKINPRPLLFFFFVSGSQRDIQ